MPDKQKDSKIMSMLERRGILRKAESDSSGSSSGGNAAGYDTDIKPLFDRPEDAVTVKSAPRQPVPGMTTPIFPSDKAAEMQKELSQAMSSSEAKPSPAIPDEAPKPASTPVQTFTESSASKPATPPSPPAAYAEPSKPAASFGSFNPFRNGDSQSSSPTAAMESVLRENSEPRPENYTDRYLNVDELYDALALRSKKTDTIYLIEDYLQTIPGSLPDSQRREIVAKLLAASGFDFDLLMGDGVLRVKMLKEYAERFARHTDDYIAARQAELDELDQQMMRTRRLIENRKELHKKQFYTIEGEAQRLKEILTFISG